MKKRSLNFCSTLLAILLIAASQSVLATGDNPLRDAGFELGQSPDEGGWALFDDSSYSNDKARSGSQSMFHWGFSRTVQYSPFLLGGVSGSYQQFPAGPGSQWRLTGYGATPTVLEGAPVFGVVQVSFFDAQGNDLGTLETVDSKTPQAKISNAVNSLSPAGEWVFLDTGIATAPESTATIQAFTLYVDYSGSNTAQGVYFDDLSLCAVKDGDDGSTCKQ